MTSSPIPHWDLSNVYPGLDSPEFKAGMEQFAQKIEALNHVIHLLNETSGDAELADAISRVTEMVNDTLRYGYTLRAYIYSFVATDSFNTLALRSLSQFEQMAVNLQQAEIRIQAFIGRIGPRLDTLIPLHPVLGAHAFFLKETAEQARYMMSEAEEGLAAELNLSGANAFSKLQGNLTSQKTVEFELDGELKTLSMPALINLHGHPDESVRRRAYEVEMKTWETLAEPLAACMNGVKGATNTLNRRRGRRDALHSALDSARIDQETLDAMLTAIREYLPVFQRYFKAKAARLGKERLAWWDICAPIGSADTRYSFEEARAFILQNFGTFSARLQAFAQRAFDHHWIDAEQRSGKRGGAFCMSVPGVRESRVLCNFDGSLDQISTIAHELGHAFHNECQFQAGKNELQRSNPMTLAETASILCETIVSNAILAQAKTREEELGILETALIGDGQVIVDIYSRFLFESEVLKRRAEAELSAKDLCEIMEASQKAAYGDGVDERYLHKYMWTWKPHYYSADLPFYNFPYSFGLLFSAGLYAIYEQRGADFVPDLEALLSSTGEDMAANLAARFGMDIRQPDFWRGSLSIIARKIDRYIAL